MQFPRSRIDGHVTIVSDPHRFYRLRLLTTEAKGESYSSPVRRLHRCNMAYSGYCGSNGHLSFDPCQRPLSTMNPDKPREWQQAAARPRVRCHWAGRSRTLRALRKQLEHRVEPLDLIGRENRPDPGLGATEEIGIRLQRTTGPAHPACARSVQ